MEDIGRYEFSQNKGKQGLYHRPHQLFLRNWISKHTLNDNILLYHSLGTGKTCSSIAIAEGFKETINDTGKRIIVIGSNQNIFDNFRNELESQCTGDYYVSSENRKVLSTTNQDTFSLAYAQTQKQRQELHSKINKLIRNHYTFVTYGDIKTFSDFNNKVVIIDEAHHLKSEQYYDSLLGVLSKSYNFRLVLLTGTPVFDDSSEIIFLSNLLNTDDFSKQINDLSLVSVQKKTKGTLETYTEFTKEGLDMLQNTLKGKISYVSGGNLDMPIKIFQGEILKNTNVYVVKCQMSEYQEKEYTKAEGFKSSAHQMEIFASISASNPENRVLKEYSTKISSIIDNINKSYNNRQTSLVFSNYIDNGISKIEDALVNEGYELATSRIDSKKKRYIVLSGQIKESTRELRRVQFNHPRNKYGEYISVVLITTASSEGITFKNLRNVHILEPHWNLSKINQVIGRAVRSGSHLDLPEDERSVRVYQYVSEFRDGTETIDSVMYRISYMKSVANSKITRLLKENSIDCYFNKDQYKDYIQNLTDYSEECDYQLCQIECMYAPLELEKVPGPSYIAGIEHFDKYQIEKISKMVINLFKIYFVWDIAHIVAIAKKEYGNVSKPVVYTVLANLTNSRTEIKDMYDRPGFLIVAGNYYVFNPFETDIESSLFSRSLEYTSKQLNESAPLPVSPESTKKKKQELDSARLDPEKDDTLIDYILSQPFYGLLTDKNVLKIVDNRNTKNEDDLRKISRGRVISTISVSTLKDIIKTLSIPTEPKLYSKSELVKVISEYIINNRLVL